MGLRKIAFLVNVAPESPKQVNIITFEEPDEIERITSRPIIQETIPEESESLIEIRVSSAENLHTDKIRPLEIQEVDLYAKKGVKLLICSSKILATLLSLFF